MPWPKGKKRSPETIAKMRAAKLGSKNPFWCKKHSLESREKMSKAKLGSKNYLWGKNLSPETIEKIRATKIGSLNPMWKGNEAKEHAIRQRLQRSMPVPKGIDRHHIDGNGRNSDPSNILVLTRREHMIKDGRMEAMIKRNKMVRGKNSHLRI